MTRTFPPKPQTPLSPREREILALAANGLTNPQIASELGISVKTVKQYKTHAFIRLGVTNQIDAFRALGWLILTPDAGAPSVAASPQQDSDSTATL